MLLMFLFLAWALASQVAAEGPSDLYSGTAPAPLGVSHGRLTSAVVDVELEETDGRVLATVNSSFRVENTDEVNPQAVTVSLPVALPHGIIFSPEVLSDVVVRVDGVERQLVPLVSGSPGTGNAVTQTYTLVLNLPAEEISVMDLGYRQDLGVGDTATFRFASSLASRWPGPVGSSKVSVGFDWPASQEQMLESRPANATFNGQQMVWYGSGIEPREDIKLTLVNPALWLGIVRARLTVTENPERAEGHFELASLYRRLLRTGPLTGTLASFQSLMLAELDAAEDKAGNEYPAITCAVHKELASFYLENMYGPSGSLDVTYLSRTVRELERALQVCPRSEVASVASSEIVDGYLYLGKEARERGHYELALDYLDSAERVYLSMVPDLTEYELEVARGRRLCYLSLVRESLEGGDFATALEYAEAGGVMADVRFNEVSAPRFGSVQIATHTDSGRRKVVLSLWPHPLAMVTDVDRSIVGALRKLVHAPPSGSATITLDGETYVLELDIPYEQGDDLFREQSAWAEALPNWPELALARAVLRSQHGEILVQDSWFTTQTLYSETVDTREAYSSLEGELRNSEAELQRMEVPETRDNDPDVLEEVVLIRKQLLAHAVDGWRNLLDSSRAVCSVDWESASGERVSRVWTIGVGEVKDMRLESRVYDFASIAVAVGLAALAVLIVVLVLFLMTGLRR